MLMSQEIYYLIKWSRGSIYIHDIKCFQQMLSKFNMELNLTDFQKSFFIFTGNKLNDLNIFLYHWFTALSKYPLKSRKKIIDIVKIPLLYKKRLSIKRIGAGWGAFHFLGDNYMSYFNLTDFQYLNQKKALNYIYQNPPKFDNYLSLMIKGKFKECNFLWNTVEHKVDEKELLMALYFIIFLHMESEKEGDLFININKDISGEFRKTIFSVIHNFNTESIDQSFQYFKKSHDIDHLFFFHPFLMKIGKSGWDETTSQIIQYNNSQISDLENKKLAFIFKNNNFKRENNKRL